MNAATLEPPTAPGAAVARAVDAACARVAPTWPLDRFIAVNPYWGWRGRPMPDAAARLATLAGTRLTMPRPWFRAEWAAGRLDERHLDLAAADLGDPGLAAGARAVLASATEPATPPLRRLPLVSDLVDGTRPGPVPGRTWTDLLVHQIGQHAAAHVDAGQATWGPEPDRGLFAAWRGDPAVTHGFRWRRGAAGARAVLASLPAEPLDAIAVMLGDLCVPEPAHEAYLTAVLASVNGWAAWCAFLRWEARLAGGDDATLVELLAVRLGWEWLLVGELDGEGGGDGDDALASWAAAWARVDDVTADNLAAQRVDWVLQAAVERTYQDGLVAGLAAAPAVAPAPAAGDGVERAGRPDVQAVFCIDVRSEVFRRALEAEAPTVHTRGFAGFFGMPIAYTPASSALTRPQLPGLLAPALAVTDVDDAGSDAPASGRAAALAERRRWEGFRRLPSSMFSYVETLGLPYAAKLVKESLPHTHAPERWEDEGLGAGAGALRPRLALVAEDPAAAAALAARVLTGMGLRAGFAPLVLLCGHGSRTANNPHAAGLDCGACGGQAGDVNARVLAAVLNDAAVRAELRSLGVDVPDTTWFVPGLHVTTTDTVELFDTDLVPAAHRPLVEDLERWLAAAGARARAERAPSLGLGDLASSPRDLERAVLARATDWSQVRPEWGLAGNAAFVVAPRARTRPLDLEGRAFLHDYDWRQDTDLGVLTLILTAPMVVTNWINLQYHASTVDNGRYGSGNKVLHNVVGGRIGVFEGNGGDLRIGLPIQSLHDGEVLRHRPLRLSVFVEAPRDAIDTVIEGHEVVQHLALNGWLHLLRIDPATGAVEERTPGGWRARPAGPAVA